MTTATLVQITVNVFMFVGLLTLWMRLRRPAKEDPRFSKGLQLLQAKIAILEDLSDKTDDQVKQICKLMDRKKKEIQETILTAQDHVNKVENSMEKSLEVASIFEDKIPHEEIMERQNSKKYIDAARLANNGLSSSEIAKKIDLDPAELDFIVKMNKDNLMFAEDQLPKWASSNRAETESSPGSTRGLPEMDLTEIFSETKVSTDRLQELGDKFREACSDVDKENEYKEIVPAPVKEKLNQAVSSFIQPLEDVRNAIKEEIQQVKNTDDSSWESFDFDNSKDLKQEDSSIDSLDRLMDRVEQKFAESDLVDLDFTEDSELNLSNDKVLSVSSPSDPTISEMDIDKLVLSGDEPNHLEKYIPVTDLTMREGQDVFVKEIIPPKKSTPPQNRITRDLVGKLKQRAKLSPANSKIKRAENASVTQLDFPEIKIDMSDNLG
ncbi:MAG: hypothetical protein AB8E15_07925 [Bdellovibrionales bacterium]